jgi:hypothetical protein
MLWMDDLFPVDEKSICDDTHEESNQNLTKEIILSPFGRTGSSYTFVVTN